jgi:hypothetical protein
MGGICLVAMNKIALVAFRGEEPCVLHVLLNCEDMRANGMDALVILEGGSVKFIKDMYTNNFQLTWDQIEPLIDCACLGCSKMFHVEADALNAKIRLEGKMSGHVSLAEYINKGYSIIVM